MNYTPVYGNTASGAIATFDTSLALPLQDCKIAINAVQSGSGTPSPDNVRPITGFTGANIHVADDENPHVIDNVTPITWQSEAGTVYGGLLDVTSGKLTVTWGSVDLGSLGWNGSNGQFNNSYNVIPKNWTRSSENWGKCSALKVESWETVEFGTQSNNSIHGLVYNDIFILRVYASDYSTADELKSALSGQMLIYELVIPVTYQLTPTQINAIVGTNNIFTDTNGDTSVVYACSLKDYIDGQ
jgi:hypothetical protein